MSKKIFARQIHPQYQESPLYTFGFDEYFAELEPVAIDGNRDFYGHMCDEYAILKQNFDEAASDYVWCIGENDPWPIQQVLDYYDFVRTDGKPWTDEQLKLWEKLFSSDDCFGDDEIILPALELMTGRKWARCTIHGLSQSDWQYLYYPADFSSKSVREIEADYFNTGSEWIIHDGEQDPASPEDISGYLQYCYDWSPEGIAKEIADACGVYPEDVVLVVEDAIVFGNWPTQDPKEKKAVPAA